VEEEMEEDDDDKNTVGMSHLKITSILLFYLQFPYTKL
jgi:hypothetical protein